MCVDASLRVLIECNARLKMQLRNALSSGVVPAEYQMLEKIASKVFIKVNKYEPLSSLLSRLFSKFEIKTLYLYFLFEKRSLENF